jgi:hypothetical protein
LRDFTLKIFKLLCTEFKKQGYDFITFCDYCSNNRPEKFVILRHDVDKLPENALKIALLENELGIKASYYFRVVKESYNEYIIKRIIAMGHEIGYHYEDLMLARGNFEQAIETFQKHLLKFKQSYPVKTICMHGNPLSRWDNRLLWQRYDYRHFDIIGEPYFDIDLNKVLYITDTGRCWDGADVNLRDKVASQYDVKFRTTFDIIKTLNNKQLPTQVMINSHPHRWNDKLIPWCKELIWQNVKNVGKRILVKARR